MRRSAPLIAGLVALTLVGAACSSKGGSSTADAAAAQAKIDAAAAKSPGALLRSTLDTVLGEHVALLAELGASAAQGRAVGVAAASDRLLVKNTSDLAIAFGTIYPDSQVGFGALWKKHITFFIDYAKAAAKNDAAGKKKASDQLTGYAASFAAFLHGVNSALPKDGVESLFKEHAKGVLDGIDAEVAKDYAKADTALVGAYTHMDMIGKALAVAIRTQHPEKLAGDPASKAADLRASLDGSLQEHSALLYNLGEAIVAKNNARAAAAVTQLNTNANDIATIFGNQYGGSAQSDLLSVWQKQTPLFESYARAVAGKNADAEATYRDDLATAADNVGKAITKLSPEAGTPDASISDFMKLHVLSIKEAIDQLARNRDDNADDALLRAIQHMDDMAAEIADAIAKQFPTKFV
ncbi:MAG TPA: hypothetical protein VGW79_00630 [Actinomycetota bacterium]|nr:hypothetical protein [Actinomycetota bacterium]